MRSARKIFLLTVIMAAVGVGFLLSVNITRAADNYGFEQTAQGTDLKALSLSKGTPQSLAEMIVQRILFFVGTIFFLLILYAGLSWMIAGGSTEKINKAKEILETAVIGLLIITASYAISTYVFSKFTGAGTADGETEQTQ